MYFHISDEKRQNASTVHENIMCVLNDRNTGASNKDVPEIRIDKLETLFEICDGAASQYRCGHVLQSIAHIVTLTQTQLYRIIQCPGHGNSKVDATCGVNSRLELTSSICKCH